MTAEETEHPDRILVLAPRGRDAELISSIVRQHCAAMIDCASPGEFVQHIDEHAGCAIIAQEALVPALQRDLAAVLKAQPPWSDFPLIVLTGTPGRRTLAAELGNVTVLERPITPQTLVVAVRAALRARHRQFEARAAIQQRDQFLAMLGHELRNPLGAIVMAADLMITDPEPANTGRRLAILQRQANHLAHLVDDLLDVARVTTGKVQLRREAVAIDDLVRATVDAVAETARKRELTIVIKNTSHAILDADPVRVAQIVNNLVANALKYSPAGRTIEIGTEIVGTMCEIRVRDHGIGITADMLGHVFELFAQGTPGIARSEGGLGVGLTLVDRLVRLHGGTVEAHSAGAECGSEFVVRLPLGRASIPKLQLVRGPSHGTGPVRVTLVEDSRDLRELSCTLLEQLGCAVDTAATGPAGLALVLATRPELALIDIGLPGMNGFELARAIRAELGRPIMLVAITGYGRPEDRDESLAAGFDYHIAKPVSAARLRELVETVRARRAA